MKQPSSWTMAYVTPLFVLLVTTAVLMIGASEAWSYPQYSEDGDSTNCRACHGDFRANPYTSPSGDSWTDDLHDVHRNDMLDGDCLTCHTSGPRFPVLLDSSTGGDELAAISCVGCHGRAEDDSVANGGTCTISDCGPGAGLRQHHFLAGVTICADCHDNADPANYTPVGEDVLPPYYFTPDQNHLNKPTDPCNPNDEEGAFGGNLLGLDNDGDDVYDTGDPDCGGSTGCQSDAECDDAAFCNGAETCNLGTGQCMPGTPVTVDDGVGCTDDSCDEINDLIVNALNDGLCDNGAFCDGLETCDAVSDCQAGTAPCDSANETCDEVGDICETDSFSIGGTVTGLQGEGLVLQNNGGDSLSIERDGQFSFQTPIPDGSSFEVTVFAQPNTVLDEICRVTYGLGTVRGSDVNEVDVRCSSVIFADGFE